MAHDLIREIRSRLSLSQAELAELLGVSFQTVNRWENGHTVPGRLAEKRLFDVCKARDVSLYEYILQKIRLEADECTPKPGSVLLFHGSKSGIERPVMPKSRAQCDFGQGFYMGTEAAQALTLVCDFEHSRLYLVSLDLTDLRSLEVPEGLDWAMLIAFHRGKMESVKGSPLYERYRSMTDGNDVVIGRIADDRMFYVLDNFFVGNVTDQALVRSLSSLKLGLQYAAITEKACKAVRIEREIPISYLERLFIRDAALENRMKGIAVARGICREYRRDGRFFDEILADAEGGVL